MTQIYAHRGDHRLVAENTQAAFDRSLQHAIDGIETDVQLTRDGVTVLFHDDDLTQLGHFDQRLDQQDFATLINMKFTADATAQIMTLTDFVARYRARCGLLLEIKKHPLENRLQQRQKVAQTLAIAGNANANANADRILVSSFDLDSLLIAQQLTSEWPLILNLEPEHDSEFARKILVKQPWLAGICVHISTLNSAMVNDVREQDKMIAAYTCNSETDILLALNLGIDILISDVPEKALHLRNTLN
ncbi:MAG: hypothetical protein RLZZ144_96 [Pseudomonadota bacterium]